MLCGCIHTQYIIILTCNVCTAVNGSQSTSTSDSTDHHEGAPQPTTKLVGPDVLLLIIVDSCTIAQRIEILNLTKSPFTFDIECSTDMTM